MRSGMLHAEVFTQLVDQIPLGIQWHQRQSQAIGQPPPPNCAGFSLEAVGLADGCIVAVQLQSRAELGKAQQTGSRQGVIEGVENRDQ